MIRYMFAIVAVLAVLANPGQAQFTAYGLGGQFLLLNKSVQEELKLSEDQLAQLREVVDKVRERIKQNLDKIRDMEPEERGKLLATIAEQTNKAAAKVLNEDQAKRLREIDLQQRGPMALYDPELRKTLKITDDQLAKLKELAADAFMQVLKAHEAGDQEKVNEAMRTAREKVGGILSDEQKKTWQEALGKPFELKPNK